MGKYYPYLGIAAVVIAYSLIVASILLSPWFSWLNNALSDLGNTSSKAISRGVAPLFDSGLATAGVLGAVFSVLLSRDERYSWKYIIWTLPLALASIDLALIGVFNESFGSIHLVVSVIFFFLTAVTLLLYSYVSFPLGAPKTGAVSLVLGIVCASVWVARFPWQGVAIQETTTSLAFSVFLVIISVGRLRPRGVAKSTV